MSTEIIKLNKMLSAAEMSRLTGAAYNLLIAKSQEGILKNRQAGGKGGRRLIRLRDFFRAVRQGMLLNLRGPSRLQVAEAGLAQINLLLQSPTPDSGLLAEWSNVVLSMGYGLGKTKSGQAKLIKRREGALSFLSSKAVRLDPPLPCAHFRGNTVCGQPALAGHAWPIANDRWELMPVCEDCAKKLVEVYDDG